MKLTRGVLADAEARAARLWGADVCRFSIGGATHANQAVALRARRRRRPGRGAAGRCTARCCWAWCSPASRRSGCGPRSTPATGLPLGVAPATVADALDRHPDVRAVLVGDPSYVGTVGDVAGLADVAHAHGVPLVVDAAWAAHFGFHPDLPRHALALGADAMVVSAHKALPAWSQAALVLARGRPDRPGAARRGCRGDRHAPARPARSSPASTPPARCSSVTGPSWSARALGRRPRGPGPALRGRRARGPRRAGRRPPQAHARAQRHRRATASPSRTTCSRPGCPSRPPSAT